MPTGWHDLLGFAGQLSGVSGTVTVPSGAVVVEITVHASSNGATFTLFGGPPVSVVNGANPLQIQFNHTLFQSNSANGGRIVFTGTDHYWVHYVYQSGYRPQPTITAVSSVLADPLGGDAITIAGTNLTNATVMWNGVAQTVTGNTGSSMTITTVAPGANGSLPLTVTTPGGATSTTLRSWFPGLIASCTSGFERPNYAKVSTTGTWTARVGSNATNGGLTAPTATNGEPVFAGHPTGLRLGQNEGSCFTMTGTPEGSTFAILNPTSFVADNAATPPLNPAIWVEESRGAIGQSISTAGVISYASDGSYKKAAQSITSGAQHACTFRFKSGVDVGCRVDANAWTNTALGTYSPTTTNLVQLGENYNESAGYTGTMRAFFTFSARVIDSDSDDCYAWAKVRHGVS